MTIWKFIALLEGRRASSSLEFLLEIKGDVAKRLLYIIPLMKKLADPNDVILLGMGLHYNDMEDLGEDMLLIGDALSQPGLPKNTIWMETLPQHYDSGNGETP